MRLVLPLASWIVVKELIDFFVAPVTATERRGYNAAPGPVSTPLKVQSILEKNSFAFDICASIEKKIA